MKTNTQQSEKYTKAKKQVEAIKKFYRHLRIYILVNIVLLVFKFKALDFFTAKGIQDEDFINWFEWNIIGTPILWGVGLLIHGIYVFKYDAKALNELKPGFIKRWEKKQLEKFLHETNKE